MDTFPDLTLATTIHNNLERWMEMALSLEKEVGQFAVIVVVDDGSAVPANPEGLGSSLHLMRNETPRGFCAASDQALREVKTPFALLADADITFLPGDFRAVYAAFQDDPRLAWCNFRQVSVTGSLGCSTEDEILPPWIYGLGNQVAQKWLERKSRMVNASIPGTRIRLVPIAHSSSVLVRMEAFRDIGGFDLRFWQCVSDNDLCMRLVKAGWKVGVDQIYTVRHDGIGGKTGGKKRVYDLYMGRLLFYEVHRPSSRLYLRPLLCLRHLVETLVALLRPKSKEEHLSPAFRFHLAIRALLGYPRT